MTTVLVVTGGDPVPSEVGDALPAADLVVAADSGLDHARALGLKPDIVVGDFDSVTTEALEAFDGPLERHPVHKDATDLELALRLAVTRRPNRIVVVGGHGGRLDHFLANALVLTTVPDGIDVEWRAGQATIHLVRKAISIIGIPGSHVSLVPVGGDACGVRTSGLKWQLAGEDLPSGGTRGVSNRFEESEATISLDSGALLVVLPGQE